MTDTKTREKQQALAARMDAGEVFAKSRSGVCPVCSAAFTAPTSKKARITCGTPECFRIFMGARILSQSDKGGRPQNPRPPQDPRDAVSGARALADREYRERRSPSVPARREWAISGDPWFVRTLDGYERPTDPFWGF